MDSALITEARRALRRLAYPLARILLRYGVSFEEFSAIAKQAYVEVAARDFSLSSRPASKSRIALLTGLNRREVARVLASPADEEGLAQESLNRSARIVATWMRDTAFRDAGGRPLRLPVEGAAPSFEALVRSQGSDIPPMTVLRELKNAGAVREAADGRIELVTAGYVPSASEVDKLQLLGIDVAALLATIDHNLAATAPPRFQRKVSFSRLSPAGVAALEAFVRERGQDFLVELDAELAAHDQDPSSPGQFAGLGMYLFLESAEEGDPT